MRLLLSFDSVHLLRGLTMSILLSFSAGMCLAAETYAPPKVWVGVKDGSSDGNPALVDGVPLWRLDAVVNPGQKTAEWHNRPDNHEPLHFTPLSWRKDCWIYDLPQYQGVKVKEGGEVEMGAYGVGAGEFCKNNALVFIAPKDGIYSLSTTIDMFKWEGNYHCTFEVSRRETISGIVRFLPIQKQALDIKKGNLVKFNGIELRKGAELIMLPAHDGYYSGGSATFIDLRISREDLAPGARAGLGASREPANRSKELMSKGNPTGINFPLCDQAVDASQKDGRFNPGLHAPHVCMGIIDVTKPPYNADNTGKSDVSDILTKAIQDNNNSGWGNKIVYLPDGIYLVSKTVTQKEGGGNVGPCVQGQSRKGTIIRLKDGTWPTANGDRHWVFKTGDGVAQNFNRIMRNMTISVGKDNDGASGLFFYGNNQSSMSDIDVISEDGKGQIGLDLGAGEQGPCLVRNTFVKGFRIGVQSEALNAVTIHNLSLEGQAQVGVQNKNHPMWIHGLTSINRVPALNIENGNIVLVNASLTGGDSSVPAIRFAQGMLFARQVTARGYSKAIESTLTKKDRVPLPTGLLIDEYNSDAGSSLFGKAQRSLNLPMKDPPEPAWEQDMTKWASVDWYRRDGRTDAEALQAAIDDKRNTTICIPTDVRITGPETVLVRGAVTRIIGTGGSLIGDGALAVVDGGPAVVKIERLSLPSNTFHRSSRTVVLEAASGKWIHHDGTGDLFVSDCPINMEMNNPKAHLWMWHFNSESTTAGLTVNGGTAWVFGWKTEGVEGCRVLATGGTLEMLGFLNYTGGTDKSPWPLFEIRDTDFSVAGLSQFTFGNWDREVYHRLVKETRNGVTKEQAGVWMALFTSWGNNVKPPASKQ